MSKALEEDGIKVSLISQGKYKVEGNPYEPLAEEARAAIQVRVSEAYDAFIQSVARNRGVAPDDVRNGFGEGRVVGARQAVELGMADRVGTLEETVNRLFDPQAAAGTTVPRRSAAASNPVNLPEAAPSSEPRLTEEEEREAQTLRERVNTILGKEKSNA